MSYQKGKTWVYSRDQESCNENKNYKEDKKTVYLQNYSQSLLIDQLFSIGYISMKQRDVALRWREDFERSGLSALSSSLIYNGRIDFSMDQDAFSYRHEKYYKRWREKYEALESGKTQNLLMDICCYDVLPRQAGNSPEFFAKLFKAFN